VDSRKDSITANQRVQAQTRLFWPPWVWQPGCCSEHWSYSMTARTWKSEAVATLRAQALPGVGMMAVLLLTSSQASARPSAFGQPAATSIAAEPAVSWRPASPFANASTDRSRVLVSQLTPLLEQHSRRGSGGSGGGGQAVPRGGSSGGSSGGGAVSGGGTRSGGSTPSGGSTGGARTRSGSGDSGTSTAGDPNGTPTYSRPRNDRPVQGTAVARRDGDRGGTTVIVDGGYYGGLYPWGWGGLGLGGYYGYYDPWGWYDPYPPAVAYDNTGYDGALKIKVKPRQAEVFVDGYFAGSVDDYDGAFQKLRLEPGPHRIEIRLDGYEPLSFEVRILPDRTVTYKGELQKRDTAD
jgi:hypothetical protein